MEQNKETQMNENKMLDEEKLEDVSGGYSQNRYDPNVCPTLNRTRYECVGFFSSNWCDHYRQVFLRVIEGTPGISTIDIYHHKCAMGAFDYEGELSG